MKIIKVLNNNVVVSHDLHENEIILMGRGLGFSAKEGQDVDESKIEKVFINDKSKSVDKLKELLTTLPQQHIEIATAIIEYASEVLDTRLNQNIYITLTDHISFAIQRYSMGLEFENRLVNEIRQYYPVEYHIGLYAIRNIKKETGIDLNEDEAASIAMHIINAEYNIESGKISAASKLVGAILDIIKNHYSVDIDKESKEYERFAYELRYILMNGLDKDLEYTAEARHENSIEPSLIKECECCLKINKLIGKTIQQLIRPVELKALAMHIYLLINFSY